ncbi:sensor histidine kinase [Leptothoe sp. PORK10 BA2]|uniref:sensor histidine kinase n=1 Tax=Leptothoe sp. PORK10 BA2 TaxID=3110254 RepID=UPI002B1EA8BE|nr:CHASE2 domain-containing protein [Leptothoe sp. PORK10 BA2]MEA5463531.1 CHASE2 domain-containing protein [Leptothoe sp. PORK10 BA2]
MDIFKYGRIHLQGFEFSGLSIIATIVLLRILGLLQTLEWDALDFALRQRPAEPLDPKVTIVTITENDIQNSLSYPIADQSLATLLSQIQTYQPRVIGLDIFRDFPVGEGYPALEDVLTTSDNIVGIQKITEPLVPGPPALPPEQVGFVDAPLDHDGFIRRSLLGLPDAAGNYQFSFTIRVAEQYLAPENLILENGKRDMHTMRFGPAEVPRFRAYTGGYVGADDAGTQTLLHFRAGATPFTKVTYSDVVSAQVDPKLLKDRVVLVGYEAISAKDFVNVASLSGVNPGVVPGIEVQAHAISQLINAALENRAFLRALPIAIEYVLIISAGLLGLGLVRIRLFLPLHFLTMAGVSGACLLLFYGALLKGLWLPVIPMMMAFTINALALYPLYQQQVQLRSQLKQREQLIEQREYLIEWTFSTIHNGPLQTLARLLKAWPNNNQSPNFNKIDLKQLNQELRDLYDAMRQEMLTPDPHLVLSQQQVINLDISLAELLYEVYNITTKRRQDFFQHLLHITDFQTIDDSSLTPEQKRELGRFLEEALLNMCKYASDMTRLTVICRPEGNHNMIRVMDNGSSILSASHSTGYGTQQAKQLARSLQGTFERRSVSPKGLQCELRWPIAPPQRQGWHWFHQLKRQIPIKALFLLSENPVTLAMNGFRTIALSPLPS